MNRSIFILVAAVFIAFVLGGALYFNLYKSQNQQIADVIKRIDAVEQTIQILQIQYNSKSNSDVADINRTTEDTVEQSNTAGINKRLDYLELLLTELIENSIVKKQHTTEAAENTEVVENVIASENQTEQNYQERLSQLENTIELMQSQFDTMSQSISPITALGSAQEELIRANRYYQELDEPGTAVQAYASLLERYELTYEETLTALTNSADSFDSAAQKHSSFVASNNSLLLSIEARISKLQKEDQGVLFSRLANGCMHGNCYEDAYRLYLEAIQTLPDNKEKVNAYWSMSFAARQAAGEDKFFEILNEGHKLGIELGIRVSHFEKEINNPREKK